ncbi:MAG TPA: hypothetical protein VMB79_10630 [Jatrophihabitans sp.]|nr:hypothetical protein [Jatrophihabitans sp.]
MTAFSAEALAALDADPTLRESLAKLPEPQAARPAGPARTSQLLGAGPGLDPDQFVNFAGATGTTNTCGQAAIASILRHYNVNLGNMGMGPWPNDLAIDQVVADGFKPDVMFGAWGTSGGTIALALQHYGLSSVSCGYVGVGGVACQGGWSWQQCWQTLQSWVTAGHPVPALVSAASVGLGLPVQAHWPIVLRIAGGQVTLGNCRGYGQGPQHLLELPVATFLDGWNFLAGAGCGYSHCFVVGSGSH